MNKFIKALKNNINYLLIIVIVVLLFKVIEIFFFQEIQIFDNRIINLFQQHILNDNLTDVMKYITLFGDKVCLTIIILSLILLLKNKKYSLYMLINVLWAVLINKVVKYSFKRARPFEKLIAETGYSFPSGHAMCSIAFYGLFIYFIIKTKMKNVYKYLFSFCFSLLVIIIGISRIYLNVHYFSDVVGGFILGVLSLTFIINMIEDYEGGNL